MEEVSEKALRAMVHRVAGRVLAERGGARHPAGHAETAGDRPGGIHVRVGACEPPAAGEPVPDAGGARPGRDLVTAECLRGTPDGGRFVAPPKAIVTALARDEAFQRGITIVEGSGVSAAASPGPLRVAVGADHGGLELKGAVVEWLRELGHRPMDLGTHDANSVDYPDYAHAVALAVAEDRADLGVCVDGAGIGSCMAANKVPGVLAAMCYDEKTARNAREHNHANVLTLGGGMLSQVGANAVLRAFLATPVGPGRHARRVALIRDIERRYRGTGGAPVKRVNEGGEACSCPTV